MRAISIVLAVLFCAALTRAETLEGLGRRIDDIVQGRNNGGQIQDLRVLDDGTIGDDFTVTDDAAIGGDLAVTGAATVTGKTQADGELEANGIVDINLSTTNHLITVDQTNTVGKSGVPLISITDARTGGNADSTNEASLVIQAAGTYGLAVVNGATSTKALYASGTLLEQDSSKGSVRIGYPAAEGWELNTSGGGAVFQIQMDYARTGSSDRVMVYTDKFVLSSPITKVVLAGIPDTTNGFATSKTLWNSNGYVCVWTAP